MSTLEFTGDGQVQLTGPNKQNGNKNTVCYVDMKTGADTAPAVVDANGARADNDLFVTANNGYRVTRLRTANGASEAVWTQNLPYRNGVRETFARARSRAGTVDPQRRHAPSTTAAASNSAFAPSTGKPGGASPG